MDLLKVKANVFGPIRKSMKENGKKGKCMEKENFFCRISLGIWEDLKMIRNMGMESLFGRMEGSIREIGLMISLME